MESYADSLSVSQIIALIFLLDKRESDPEKLRSLMTHESFMKSWKENKERYRTLIANYPDEEEEKHFLTATIEAVYGPSPYSDEFREVRDNFMPIIDILVDVV